MIERLEQALKVWENMSASTAAYIVSTRAIQHMPPYDLPAPLKNWREFRDYLIRFRGEQFALDRFCRTEIDPTRNAWDGLPASIAAWTAFSRTAYHLNTSLQAALELTPVSNLRWGDVPWPFTSFALMLNRPINNLYGQPCDLILVNRRLYWKLHPGIPDEALEMRLIPRAIDTVPVLQPNQLKRWARLQRDHKWTELQAESGKYLDRLRFAASLEVQVYQITTPPDLTIADNTDVIHFGNVEDAKLRPDWRAAESMAVRLVVGFCLYLTTLPAKSPLLRYEQTPTETGLVRPITSGANVCTVLSSFTLSDEEIDSLGGDTLMRPYHEIAPHWRRGHFRRPPGQGNNPNASRTVWVRPCLVKKERLAADAQVGGAQVDVE